MTDQTFTAERYDIKGGVIRVSFVDGEHTVHWKRALGGRGRFQATLDVMPSGRVEADLTEVADVGGSKRVMKTIPAPARLLYEALRERFASSDPVEPLPASTTQDGRDFVDAMTHLNPLIGAYVRWCIARGSHPKDVLPALATAFKEAQAWCRGRFG